MNLKHPVKKFYFSRIENFKVSFGSNDNESTNQTHTLSFSLKFGYPVII